jgi:para-aminobenzoate synthetase component 1
LRTKHIHNITNVENFKNQLLIWAQQFDDVVWLDSNSYKQNYSNYDAVLAVDAFTSIQTDYHQGFEKLKDYQTNVNDWIFGYLTYDLKNDIEALKSDNFDGLEFPDLYFFQPKKLFFIKGETLEIQYLNYVDDEHEKDLKTIRHCEEEGRSNLSNDVKIKLRIHKDEYFEKINNILAHIRSGDIYEANFCQEFYAENTQINPLETYNKLNRISNPPFATFLKYFDKYLLSASPERYLKKDRQRVISQPIKGTAKRSDNLEEDALLTSNLLQDEKERSENIMIVDLVRNDLSKTALKGTVNVEELCKIYTFDQVHQMISTVTSKVDETTHPVDIIKSTFPMGSMTGAPKISAMKIIEVLEETKRGLYSGAVGYFSPDNNFDFNVVIRSIIYNETKKYVSYSVGSAITAKSDPLKEYEECLVKAKAMRTVLEN